MSQPYEAILKVAFIADDAEAAQAMGEELLRVWNERVQPDVPSTLDSVQPVAG